MQNYCSMLSETVPEIGILPVSAVEIHVVADALLDPFAADTTIGVTELALNVHRRLRRLLREFPRQILAPLSVVIGPDI